MAITLRTNPNDRLIELGGGANPIVRPNCDVRQCFDAGGNPTVDFTANFEEPLPIQTAEFDGVLSRFCIEHISWRKVRQFVGEVFRILKPGGKAAIVTANTEAQLKWIQEHKEGWDGRDAFDSCSCVLFGEGDYPENTHKAYFSPDIAFQLFRDAGFHSIVIQPYGDRATDLLVEATKPIQTNGQVTEQKAIELVPQQPEAKPMPQMTREEMFDRH